MRGAEWIDKRTKQAGDFGKKYGGTAGKVVAGGLGRIVASTAMVAHGAAVGVPMLAGEAIAGATVVSGALVVGACVTAFYLIPKRVLGTATLFGNLLRKKIFQNIEDKLSPAVEKEAIDEIYNKYETECKEINKDLFNEIKNHTDAIANANTEEAFKNAVDNYKEFMESPKNQDSLKAMDEKSKELFDTLQKYVKTQERKNLESHMINL